ncbi:MAG TPA: glycosyltransferase family A protein [Solirubrobacteraceae bacterium]|nr:glycosyltransferase family A protein [Solirubrobacteraceae bacterium]
MPEPSVGVAIAVRDCERWLGACIDSVLAQPARVSAIAVVDDGSEDATASVAERYAPLVRLVRIRRSGVAVARSRAFALLDTDVIVSIDADDLLTAAGIEARLAALRATPALELVFGHERRFSELLDGAPVPVGEPRPAPLAGAMLVRRAAYEQVGGFDAGIAAEGLDWLLRARELGLAEHTVTEQVTWRRIHACNSAHAAQALSQFPRVLKTSLDRRRAASGAAPLVPGARHGRSQAGR